MNWRFAPNKSLIYGFAVSFDRRTYTCFLYFFLFFVRPLVASAQSAVLTRSEAIYTTRNEILSTPLRAAEPPFCTTSENELDAMLSTITVGRPVVPA